MTADPIIEEVWRSKDELAREAGYDIHRLCENTRKWAAEHPRPRAAVRNRDVSPSLLRDAPGEDE